MEDSFPQLQQLPVPTIGEKPPRSPVWVFGDRRLSLWVVLFPCARQALLTVGVFIQVVCERFQVGA